MSKYNFTVTDLNSSLIRGVDFYCGVLTVDLGAALYAYNSVPLEMALEFISAPSLGQFYNEHIKGSFDSLQLS